MARTVTLTNAKLIGAILAVLTAAITGGGVTYKALGSENGNGLRAIHARQDATEREVTTLREQVSGMRTLLDTLLVKTSNAESKLDMVLTMLRDHTVGER